jgi:cytochrome c oxidase assembly factor CtaG
MQHVGWPLTLLIPIVLALVIAVTGVLNPQLPRGYFIAGFLFVLIVLPGILVTLKVLGSPVTATEVTLVGTRRGQNVEVMFSDGAVDIYQNTQLYNGLLTGELKPGERLRVLIRGDILFRWQRL